MKVLLHNSADKYLKRLNARDRERMKESLRDLAKDPPEGDIKPVVGQPGRWRLRVGGYRALFEVEDANILVTHIEPRGQAYTKKTKTNRGKK